MVRARPALLKVFVHGPRRLALRIEGELETEQRPAVVRMIFEFLAIDPFRIVVSVRLKQAGAQPVSGGERQGLGLVVHQLVFQLDRSFERGDGCAQLAGLAVNLAFQDASDHSEQMFGIVKAQPGL